MSGLQFAVEMALLLASVGFIVGLRMLGSPKTARLGNAIGALGMLLAVIMSFILARPSSELPGLIGAILFGSLVGIYAARKVEMTGMPQLVAAFNGVGGAASILVAACEMMRLAAQAHESPSPIFIFTAWFSAVVGAVTFTGSMCAYGKLEGWISSRAILFTGQRLVSGAIFLGLCAGLVWMYNEPLWLELFWAIAIVSSVFGVLLVLPIGGADMPVVISLLNSYSGLAAMAAGFVVDSKLLIIAGALVGASGIILTRLMCTAMNRSLANVVFGAFGTNVSQQGATDEKPMREFTPMDAAMLLHDASRVIFVPGYGLAVSQAQHIIRDLANALKESGVDIRYAIHPVAGRMPGHMNVLLAEADIPYEELKDLEEINGEFENTDVAVVIGANDVVNPSARTDKNSPLYGMPILNADKARSVIVMKRGRGTGFAGVENSLFTLDRSGVVFGDAKKSLSAIINELKQL